MDLTTVIGFGVAVSVPVWLVLEEIASRRRMVRPGQVKRKAGVASERFKRRAAPAMPRPSASHTTLSRSAETSSEREIPARAAT